MSRMWAATGLRAAFHWKSSGTHFGPIDPPGFPATGKPIDVDGVDLHEYRDGKIARLRIISNMNDVAVQLGLLPAPGSS
ncbi:snoaL-like polyketide cyclase [Rhodococcus sp. Br-6]|nr:snoaL-like polyketide cyclase [Rhodococcus sp. Br-6]